MPAGKVILLVFVVPKALNEGKPAIVHIESSGSSVSLFCVIKDLSAADRGWGGCEYGWFSLIKR